eukprot:scaffold112642_cov109-Cyclotella_meneghiniana.AAC.2
MKRSEEIVMFALGLSDELKEEQKGKLVYPNVTVKNNGRSNASSKKHNSSERSSAKKFCFQVTEGL